MYTHYALANMYDPILTEKFGVNGADCSWYEMYRLLILNDDNQTVTAERVIETVKSNVKLPFNIIFALKETGEIGYTMTGRLPNRPHKISHGAYPKYGYKDEN